MSKTIFSFFLATVLLAGVLIVLQAQSFDSDSGFLIEETHTSFSNGVSILRSDEDGLSFVLVSDPIAFGEDDGLSSDGLNMVMQESGSPALPYFSTFIALPPGASISVDVYQEGVSLQSGVAVGAVVEPMVSFVNSDPDSPFPATAVSPQPAAAIPNPDIYAADALYPHHSYQLSEPVYFRDMRLVKLDVYPVHYNPLRRELQHAQQLRVELHFEGAQLEHLQPVPSKDDAYQSNVADMVLNFEQGKAWRSLPVTEQDLRLNSLAETAVSLPLGTTSYKIDINQDGIYNILGSDLAAAGMNIASTNPATIQMMSRGENVAYDFIKIGTNPTILESNDIIRFYGEGVNGSRREKQFLTHNVYWLWANGTATNMADVSNAPGAETATTFTDSITREDELYFFSTWTNEWDEDPSGNAWNDFPNEADSWYWALFGAGTKAYSVNLPDPVLSAGQTATYTVEFMTREYDKNYTYQIDTCLNSPSACTQRTWIDHKNVNVTQSVPMTALQAGNNVFTVTLSGSTGVEAYMNRITVDYVRTLKAQNDQLFFTDAEGGRAMVVQDFSENNPNNLLVWDITSPKTPTQVLLDNGDRTENNGRYTYTIGINSSSSQNYIATTTSNILTTTGKISAYAAPTTLNPVNGADWVAISHGNFITAANKLAAHRQLNKYGGFSTHVVNIKDVINIYGYGLPMPEAIQAYLKNALLTWPTSPSYVALVGDGVVAPRKLDCAANCSTWDKNAENYVPTDMQFKDRIQGLIPSDNPLVFLVGDDLQPDMAIGRLTVETEAQATAVVDKIIRYEENLLSIPANGKQRILFLADFPDPKAGGSFCLTNLQKTGSLLPANDYEQIHLCRENYANNTAFKEAFKTEAYEGVSIVNYRGHGAVERWGVYRDAATPSFWTTDISVSDDTLKNEWGNINNPAIVLSADCLDGYFAWPGRPGVGERFLKLTNLMGSVAHWGSAGLGYDSEHTILMEGIYKGMVNQNQINLGDAVNYAKLYFMQSSVFAESELYSFNLQGDPAMMAVRPALDNFVFLPMITK
ncbi:MAG: hypothetical protein IAF02_03015 [Anaerolineae bacterium]|nr:hypothetical protein [Anaerolineae bacterium]